MRNAYALLGLLFLIVLGGAYLLIKRAESPESQNQEVTRFNERTLMNLTLSSPAFADNTLMPSTFTCDGRGTSPELHIEGVPKETKSLVLLMYDPDIPDEIKTSRNIAQFNHWVLYYNHGDTHVVPEAGSVGVSGLNGTGKEGYYRACPPTQYEPSEHRYIFELYALRDDLVFTKTPTLEEVQEAIRDMIIEKTTLTGKYERIKDL